MPQVHRARWGLFSEHHLRPGRKPFFLSLSLRWSGSVDHGRGWLVVPPSLAWGNGNAPNSCAKFIFPTAGSTDSASPITSGFKVNLGEYKVLASLSDARRRTRSSFVA